MIRSIRGEVVHVEALGSTAVFTPTASPLALHGVASASPRSCLRELRTPSLEAALAYLDLLAEQKAEKLERACVRWHGRLETEAPFLSLGESSSRLPLSPARARASGARLRCCGCCLGACGRTLDVAPAERQSVGNVGFLLDVWPRSGENLDPESSGFEHPEDSRCPGGTGSGLPRRPDTIHREDAATAVAVTWLAPPRHQ